MTARILLVEDDNLERARLESALTHLGFAVTACGDGDAALERLAAEPFDLMLLDLVLPGLDGMGVLGVLRARGCPVPVVAAVTHAGLDGAASALRAGARDFVVKPAGTLRLKVAITNALALAAAERTPPVPLATAPVREPYLRLAHDADALQRADVDETEVVQGLADVIPLVDAGGHARPLEQLEAEVIRAAIALYGGRMTEVARRLGIGRSTLYRKLTALGLPVTERFTPLAVAAE